MDQVDLKVQVQWGEQCFSAFWPQVAFRHLKITEDPKELLLIWVIYLSIFVALEIGTEKC